MVFFGGLFFWGFNIKRFVFGVSGIVSKVLKMLVFSHFWGVFLGWLIVVHLGLEGLGVFVFLVFVFLFCLVSVSVLFAVFLVLWLDVVFCLCFCCFFVLVCFFAGFKGHVRWPEGPPHLALNPPYLFFFFLCFVFFFCFFVFCLCFLEGLRVRWGGPKGHLTWP